MKTDHCQGGTNIDFSSGANLRAIFIAPTSNNSDPSSDTAPPPPNASRKRTPPDPNPPPSAPPSKCDHAPARSTPSSGLPTPKSAPPPHPKHTVSAINASEYSRYKNHARVGSPAPLPHSRESQP